MYAVQSERYLVDEVSCQDTFHELWNKQRKKKKKKIDLRATPSLQVAFSFMGVDLRHCWVVYSSIAESLFIPMGL